MAFHMRHSILKRCAHSLYSQSPTTGARLLQEHRARGDSCHCPVLSPWGKAEGRRGLAMAGCRTPSKEATHYSSNCVCQDESQPCTKNLRRNHDVGCCLVCPTVWTQLLHYWSLHSFTPSMHSSNGNDFIKFQPSELFRKTVLDRALESSLPISLSLAIHQSCQELVSYTAVLLTACYWRVNKI